jgi:hypothetical protein
MRALPLLAILLLLSGCAGSFGGLGDGQADIPQVDAPGSHGLPAGSASGHGAPQVSKGQVAVKLDGNRWRATQVVDVRNGFGGADRAALSLASFNGAIEVTGTGADGYRGTVTLSGSGPTEQAAREALATLELRTPDSLGGDTLVFGLHVIGTGTLPAQSGRGGSITLETPRGPHYNLGADTSNGAIRVTGLTGERVVGDTSNGDATLTDVVAKSVVVDTSNGGIKARGLSVEEAAFDTSNGPIDVDATADTVTFDTSNGPIEATLRPAATGHYTLDSSNGQVTLKLPGDGGHGYDATASTSNGKATVTLPGGEPVGDQDPNEAHARTAGFSGKSIRTTIVADSSNSDVRVTAS